MVLKTSKRVLLGGVVVFEATIDSTSFAVVFFFFAILYACLIAFK